ncbi:MAG: precorrin-3B C(17)-methyltransferase [Lachnospiraceae bacterium]
MNQIYVVGIGPGKAETMTKEAVEILSKCDVIVGYTVYVKLIQDLFPEKEMVSTPMKQEVSRCRMAFEKAMEGHRVAMVCSGDAGVYGLAGLMLELEGEYPDCQVEIIPGVTAALSGAAVLGAPLTHDFAVISLSDLLTPWETIQRRIQGASMADFVICLYNPSSKKRHDYLKKACEIMLKYKEKDTVCGIVSNIGREGECARILSLEQLKETQADMFTTVFIGNSQTKNLNHRMVTPRGYRYEQP